MENRFQDSNQTIDMSNIGNDLIAQGSNIKRRSKRRTSSSMNGER